MYAIIEDSGTQIKVSQGDVIKVALREMSENTATLTFDKVLLVGDAAAEGSTLLGLPYVDGAKVTADVLGEEQGDKVISTRFRRRKRILKRRGHRQEYIKVKVTAIQA